MAVLFYIPTSSAQKFLFLYTFTSTCHFVFCFSLFLIVGLPFFGFPSKWAILVFHEFPAHLLPLAIGVQFYLTNNILLNGAETLCFMKATVHEDLNSGLKCVSRVQKFQEICYLLMENPQGDCSFHFC